MRTYRYIYTRQTRKINIWLAKSPHRYPKIPYSGIKKNTLAMRIPRLNALMIKDRYVLPMPFMKLISVLFV